MAAETPIQSPSTTSTAADYEHCLITPMGRNGDQLVEATHVIDAVLVGLLVFFAIILGDALTALASGQFVYLTVEDIVARIPTGVVAFGLTFVFQWLRARGLDLVAAYRKLKESLP